MYRSHAFSTGSPGAPRGMFCSIQAIACSTVRGLPCRSNVAGTGPPPFGSPAASAAQSAALVSPSTASSARAEASHLAYASGNALICTACAATVTGIPCQPGTLTSAS